MAKMIQPTEIKKVGSGLYVVPGIVSKAGEPVFLYLRDKRKEIKKDFGWVVAVGQNLTELTEGWHDRRSKAVDDLNARIKSNELVEGTADIKGLTITGYGGFQITVTEEAVVATPQQKETTGEAANGNEAPKPASNRGKGYKPPEVTGKETVRQLQDIFNAEAEKLGYEPIEKHRGTKQDLINRIKMLQPKKGGKKAA